MEAPGMPVKRWRWLGAKAVANAVDIVLVPFTAVSGCVLWMVRRLGVARLPVNLRVLRAIGVFPIRDHYYEPLFNPRHLRAPLDAVRSLPGIDWNVPGQLALLDQFTYQDELRRIPLEPTGKLEFYLHNGGFEAGDAELLYSIIRLCKPRRIVEVGCGFSTLLAETAIRKNREENPTYGCTHVCIEPYERPWLEQVGVTVKRQLVETVDTTLFTSLGANDILFIDSSHVIRPQGDVLFEFLEVLPLLAPGVLVHVHDIWSPRDYPSTWVIDQVDLFNEQYLLEALLSCSQDFEVVAGINMLARDHTEALAAALPGFARERATCNPGSFWLKKVR
jgi:predicted O-methyltransferase YrrM